MAMHPGGNIAGIGRDDRVFRRLLGDGGDHFAEIDAVIGLLRLKFANSLMKLAIDLIHCSRPDDTTLVVRPSSSMRPTGSATTPSSVRNEMPDWSAIRIDVDQWLRRFGRAGEIVIERRDISEPRARRNHEIGFR